MAANERKRAVSFAVFGLGILAGLFGCTQYPAAMFVVGVNDSAQEVWALTFALATPFFACILALWQRVIAGIWLIFAGCFWVYGMIAQRTYMIQVRHFAYQPTVQQTLHAEMPLSWALITMGLFALITDMLKWPRLLGRSARVKTADNTLGI
jgi:hypothetical protein